ncbi:MAG TPA: hypothetical protein GXX29_01395 [Firmicutes bacterium]|nr:hypothetical protein [Bacillota bacterium]
MKVLLIPPIAFLIYVLLSTGLFWLGRLLAPENVSDTKATLYASGEAPPSTPAALGYRQFFAIALFFAVLHLGILVLGTSELTPVASLYIGGLIIALAALILG